MSRPERQFQYNQLVVFLAPISKPTAELLLEELTSTVTNLSFHIRKTYHATLQVPMKRSRTRSDREMQSSEQRPSLFSELQVTTRENCPPNVPARFSLGTIDFQDLFFPQRPCPTAPPSAPTGTLPVPNIFASVTIHDPATSSRARCKSDIFCCLKQPVEDEDAEQRTENGDD